MNLDPARAALPAVEARGLSKAFDGRPANADVNFRAFAGEIHAVLGENGAGKSTLISMLSGEYYPDGGDILVAGRRVAFRSPHDALRAGIGVVHQELKLIDNLSVAENVILGTGLRPTNRTRKRIRALARRAGFDVNQDWPVHILNISQRQQVEIVKLLFRNLDVLIFDEPTAVLGEAQVAKIFGVLAALKQQGKAIILITHRLREVRAIADRLTILRRGRVVLADRSPGAFTDDELAELMVGAGPLGAEERARHKRAGDDEAILTLRDVRLSSLSGSGLRGVSFALRRGELVGVAGVRGNGQRELAELAAGILNPTAGSVERVSSEVAFIPDDRLGVGLARSLSVGENLALRIYRRPPIGRLLYKSLDALRRHAETLIEHYEIPSRHGTRVTRLSGGGLQRVVVARELARELPLLVAAQPTRGLDVRSAAFVRGELVAAARRGAGVLVISEDLDELMKLADRILVLYEGQVTASIDGPTFDRQVLGRLILGGRTAGTNALAV